MWSFKREAQLTCPLQMFLGPAVQSCHNCTLLLALRHVSAGQTQQSGLEIAVEPNIERLWSASLCMLQLSVKVTTLICIFVEPTTFQTEKAKLRSGALTRVSSSSISTAEDQSKNK